MTTASTPTAASVQAQIEAVTLSQALATLQTLATSLSAGASSIPAGTLLAAEDIAGLIDPDLIPVLGAVQAILPYVGEAIGLLGAGAADGPRWLGAPRAI